MAFIVTSDALIESTIRWIRRMYGAWPYALGLPGGYATGRFCLFEMPPPISDLTSMAPLQPAREIDVLMFDFRSPDRRWAYRMQSTSAWLPVEPTTYERRWPFSDMPEPGELWHVKGRHQQWIVVDVTSSHVLVKGNLPTVQRAAKIDLTEFLKEWERA